MKRAVLIGASTAAGVAALLAYQTVVLPEHAEPLANSLPGNNVLQSVREQSSSGSTAGQTPAATPSQSAAASSGAPQPTDSSTAPSPTASAPTQDPNAINGTYTGDPIDTPWGPVQVEAVVENSTLVSAKAIQFPQNDRKSATINARAIPELEQQAIDAQGANISGVSGASYSSSGFSQSLQSALMKIGQ